MSDSLFKSLEGVTTNNSDAFKSLEGVRALPSEHRIVNPNTDKYGAGYLPADPIFGNQNEFLNKYKAGNQPTTAKAVNMLARGVAKAAISMVEPIGFLADIEQWTTDVNQVEENYGNWFNQMLRGWEDSLDKSMPIYTEEEQPAIFSGDWWLKNGDQVIKSLGYFVPGLAGTKAAGALLKGLTGFTKGIKATNKIAKGVKAAGRLVDSGINAIAPVMSATAMNYSEHMISAMQAFKENKEKYYTQNIKNGMTQDEAIKDAKFRASEDAEDIVMGGKVNIIFNALEYSNLFKAVKATKGAAEIGKKAIAKTILATAGSEYAEEVTTGFLESEARRKADIATGAMEDDGTSGATRYLDHLTSYEGLTEGILGAIGGGGMQIISTLLSTPSRKKVSDQLKENKAKLGDVNSVQKITNIDFYKNMYDNARAGTFEDVYKNLDAVANLTEEQATAMQLAPDFREKVLERKQDAEQFEKDYNDLNTKYQKDQVVATALINNRITERESRKEVLRLDDEIKENLKSYTEEERQHPLFKTKQKMMKLHALQVGLKNNDELIAELDVNDPASRTYTTNETGSEIESRTGLIYDKMSELEAEIESEIAAHKEKVSDKKEDGTIKYEKRVDNKINKYLYTVKDDGVSINLNGTADEKIQNNLIEHQVATAVMENASRVYNKIYDNPSEVDKYRTKVEKKIKDIAETNIKTGITEIEAIKDRNELTTAKNKYKAKPFKEALTKKEKQLQEQEDKINAEDSRKKTAEKTEKKKVVPTPKSPTVNEPETDEFTPSPFTIGVEANALEDNTEESIVDNALDRKDNLDKMSTILSKAPTEIVKDIFFMYSNDPTELDTMLEAHTAKELTTVKKKMAKMQKSVEGKEAKLFDPILGLLDNRIEVKKREEAVTDNVKVENNAEVIDEDGFVNNAANNKLESNSSLGEQFFMAMAREDENGVIRDDGLIKEVLSKNGNLKAINTGNSIAYLSKDYIEVDDVKYTSTTESNKKLNTLIETGKINVGTKLVFTIDKDYKFEDETYYTLEKNYKGDEWINNIPIKVEAIVDGKPQFLHYIHTTNWVAKNSAPVIYIEEQPINNTAIQVARIKKIRKSIVDNNGGTGKISYKSGGHISLNIIVEDGVVKTRGKDKRPLAKREQVSVLLPGVNHFAINRFGSLIDGKNSTVPIPYKINDTLPNGMVWGIVKDARGQTRAVPLISPKISSLSIDNTSADTYNSLQIAVDWFFSDIAFDDNANKVLDKNNIRTIGNLLSQYLYVKNKITLKQKFEVAIQNNSLRIGKQEGFIYSARIEDGTPIFERYNSLTDNTPVEVDANEFLDRFKELLQNSRFSTKISKINSIERIPEYTFEFDENDMPTLNKVKWYDNYNAFIKDKLQTRIDGRNKAKNGEYIYFNHPNLEFELNPTSIETNDETTPTNIDKKPSSEDIDVNLDDIGAIMSAVEPSNSETSVNKTANDGYNDRVGENFIIQGLDHATHMDIANSIAYAIYKDTLQNSKSIQGESVISTFANLKVRYEGTVRSLKNILNSNINVSELSGTPKEVLNSLGITSNKQLQNTIKYFDLVLEQKNWDILVKDAIRMLKSNGYVVRDSKIDVDTQFEEGEQSSYETIKFNESSRFKLDKTTSAATKLRLFMSSLNAKVKNNKNQYVLKRSVLGLPTKVDGKKEFDNLIASFVDTVTTYDEVLDKLGDLANNNYVFEEIRKGIVEYKNRGLATNLINSIINHRYEQVQMFRVPIAPAGFRIGNRYVILNNNQNTAVQSIKGEWLENQKRSSKIRKINQDNSYYIDVNHANKIKTKFKELVEYYKDNLTSENFIEELSDLISELGLDFGTSVLTRLSEVQNADDILGHTWEVALNIEDKNSLFGSIFEAYKQDNAKDVTSLIEANNPLYYNGSLQFINKIAKLKFSIDNRNYSNSALNSDGELQYEPQNYAHISSQIRRLKIERGSLANQILGLTFGGSSLLVPSLVKKGDRDKLRVRYFDATATFTGKSKTNRKSMSKKSQDLFSISMFQSTTGSHTNYVGITMADHNVTPVYTFPKHEVNLDFTRDGYNLSDQTIQLLYKAAENEINRITHVQELIDKGVELPYYTKIGKFKDYATKFILFDYLNKQSVPEIWFDGKLKITVDNIDKVYQAINDNTIKQIQKAKDRLLDSGIIEYKHYDDGSVELLHNKNFDYTYMKNIRNNGNAITQPHNRINYAIADFYINNQLATVEQFIMFMGDPALYGEGNHFRTLVNIQKRAKGIISPRETGNFFKKTYTTATSNTRRVDSTNEYLTKLGHVGIDSTDAAEFTTVKEDIEVRLAYDLIPLEVYESILEKIETSTDGYYTLDDIELGFILSPIKPFAFDNDIDNEFGINARFFRKSGSYPLVPQVTKGLDIDKIRVAMERDGIDRLGNTSSDKAGAKNVSTIYDANGKILDDIVFTPTLRSREDFGRQQVMTYGKEKITLISQMNKLLFNNVRLFTDFNYDGKTWTGRKLELEKERVRKRIFEINKENLFEKLGVVNEDGKLRFTDLRIVQKALLEEADNRGWQTVDIQQLELTEDGQFEVPLIFNNSVDRIQSLLLSLINKVVKYKQPGAGFVQVPGANYSTKNAIVYKDLTAKEKKEKLKGLVTTKSFDESKGLQHTRKEDGKVKPSQVFIAWNFRNSKGKLLDIDNFVDEDGNIDFDKLPQKVLQAIGARIPNQAHSSMMPFEIVGFLPHFMQGTVMVADEIVTQMGADFDIDKLYSYLTQYQVNYDGEIQDKIDKVRELIKALYEKNNDPTLESFNDLMTNLENSTTNYNDRFKDPDYKNKIIEILNNTVLYNFNSAGSTAVLDYLESLSVEELERINAARYKKKQGGVETLPDFIDENNVQLASYIKRAITIHNGILKEELDIDYIKEQIDYIIGNNKERKQLNQYLKELKEVLVPNITLDNFSSELQQLQQEYQDIHWAVLTHPQVYDLMLTPLDNDDLMFEYEDVVNKKGLSILDFGYQNDSFLAQQDGKDLIAITSLYNIFMSSVQPFSDISISTVRNNERKADSISVKLDDGTKLSLTNFNGEATNIFVDDKGNPYKRTKSGNIVILQNGAVDNANKPYLGALNINTNTINVALTLMSLQDINGKSLDIRYATRLMTQDIIVEYVEELKRLKEEREIFDDERLKKTAMSNVAERYTNKLNGKRGYSKILPSAKELKNIRESKDKTTDKYINQQLNILRIYRRLDLIADDISIALDGILYGYRKGSGSSIYDSMRVDTKINEISSIEHVNNLDKLLYTLDKEGNSISSEDGAAHDNSVKIANELVGTLVGINTPVVKTILNTIKQIYGTNELSGKQTKEIYDNIRKAVFSGYGVALGITDVNQYRQYLNFDTSNTKSLGTRIEKLQNTRKGKDLTFLQSLTVERGKKNNNHVIVKYDNNKSSNVHNTEQLQSFTYMLTSNDLEIKEVAEDLVKYSYLNGGIFSPISFTRFVTFNYLKEVGFAKALRNINFDNTTNEGMFNIKPEIFVRQFIQHLPHKATNLPKLDILDYQITKGNDFPLEFTIEIQRNEFNKPQIENYYVQKDFDKNKYLLWELKGKRDGKLVYIQIDTLGNANPEGKYSSEYNLLNPFQTSNVEQNNVNYDTTKNIEPIPIEEDVTPKPSNKSPIESGTTSVNLSKENVLSNYFMNGELNRTLDIVGANNVFFGQLANIYKKKLVANKQNFILKYAPLPKNISANIKGNVITIDPQEVSSTNPSGSLDVSILHEITHGLTRRAINNFFNDRKGLNTPKENASIARLYELMEFVIAHEKKNNKELGNIIDRLKKKDSELRRGIKDNTQMKKGDYNYYYFTSLHEFVAETMTNSKFQALLNNIKYNKDKSVFEKFKDLLTKLIANIAESIGITITDNSALQYAIGDILNLMNVDENIQLGSLEDLASEEGEVINKKAEPNNINQPQLFSIKPNKSPIRYQNNTTQSNEKYVASEKTIRDIASRMSDRIGMKVRYENNKSLDYKGKIDDNTAIINLAYATLDTPIHEILGHPIIRAINKNANNKRYDKLNEVKALLESKAKDADVWSIGNNWAANEFRLSFGEPVSKALELVNKEINKLDNNNVLYQNLLKELETGKGKEVLDRIKRDYKYKKTSVSEENYNNAIKAKNYVDRNTTTHPPKLNGATYLYKNDKLYVYYGTSSAYAKEISIDDALKSINKVINTYKNPTAYTLEEQQEEALVELLGLYTAGKIEAAKNKSLYGYLKQLLKKMNEFVRSLINQKEVKINTLPDNITIGDLANILAYSNNKIILPGYEVIYTTPDNKTFKTYQEASNHISKLSKLEEVNLKEVGLSSSIPNGFKYNEKEVDKVQYSPEEAGVFSPDDNVTFPGEPETGIVFYKDGTSEIFYEEYIPEFVITYSSNMDKVKSFINANKKYEQSKEIIEEWKRVNNITYNPKEVYSRGQGFYSVVGAYSDLDMKLLLQNLLDHIEDNKKAGGEFIISAFTKPITNKIKHIEGEGGKVRFKIFPESKDIKWAANKDVYSGSVWDASSKLNSKSKSETLGVSYTKYPALHALSYIKPNLSEIIDDIEHYHNELGIELTGTNFRLEYDNDLDYSTRKLIDNVNNILDKKYGKLVEPEISKKDSTYKQIKYVVYGTSKGVEKVLYRGDSMGESKSVFQNFEDRFSNLRVNREEVKLPSIGKQPTQTKDNTKNISTIQQQLDSRNKVLPNKFVSKGKYNGYSGDTWFYKKDNEWYMKNVGFDEPFNTTVDNYNITKMSDVGLGIEEVWKSYLESNPDGIEDIKIEDKEYTSQAEINTKIAALKNGYKKFPRSLITSEVYALMTPDPVYTFIDELPFQKVPSQPEEPNFVVITKESVIKAMMKDRLVGKKRFKNPKIAKNNPDYKGDYYILKNGTKTDIKTFGKTEEDVNNERANRYNSKYAKGLPLVTTVRTTNGWRVELNQKVIDTLNNIRRENARDKGALYSMHENPVDVELSVETNSLLLSLRHRVNEYYRKISVADTQAQKDELKEKATEIELQMQEIRNNVTADAVLKVANNQLDYVDELLSSSKFNDVSLNLAWNTIDMWSLKNSKAFLTKDQQENKENEYNKAYAEIAKRADVLQMRMLNAARKYVKNRYNETLSKPLTDKDLEQIKDIGFGSKFLLDVTKYNIPLARAIASTIIRAHKNRAGVMGELNAQITDAIEALKADKYASDNIDLIFQVDEAGKKTGKLTDMFSSAWFATKMKRETRIENIKNANLTNKEKYDAYRELTRDWRRNTLHIDISLLGITGRTDTGLNRQDFKSIAEYKKYLIDELGENLYTIYYEKAKTRYAKYVKDKNEKFKEIEDDIDILDKATAKREWEIRYSPEIYLDNLYGVLTPEVEESGIRLEGSRYTSYAPRKYRKDSATGKVEPTNFYDKRFEQITNNKGLYDFWKFHTDFMGKMIAKLPYLTARELDNNFMAQVQNSILARLSGDMKGVLGMLSEEFIDAITSNEIAELTALKDRTYRERNSNTGRIAKNVPVLHTNLITDPKKLSYNLEANLRLFMTSAVNNEYMSDIEDISNLANRVLNEAEELARTKNDKSKFDMLDKIVTYKDGKMKVLDSVDYLIDSLIYGEKRGDESVTSMKIYSVTNLKKQHANSRASSELNRQANEIQEQMDNLSDKGELTQEIAEDLQDKIFKLNEKYKELGGKNVSLTKLSDKLMAYVQLKGLGLNFTAGISNMLFGIVSNVVHSNGRKEFNGKNIRQAFGIILKSIVNKNKATNKVYNMLNEHDVLFDTIDVRYGRDTGKGAFKFLGKHKLDLYVFQTKSEYFVQAMSFIAHMLNKKVTTKDGRTISLYEAYGNDGKINTELISEEDAGKYNTILKAQEKNEYSDTRDTVIQMNKILHGNYDPSSPMLVKKYILGRMLTQFRTWLPEGVANRFQELRYDEQLKRDIKGRWVTYADLGIVESINTLCKQLLYRNDAFIKNGVEMKDYDVENMRRNLAELLVLGSMASVMLALRYMLKAGEDDEDRWYEYTFRILYNALYRARQDVFMYLSPSSFYSIIKDPLPVTRAVTDMQTAIYNSYLYTIDEEYKGDNPFIQVGKALPLSSQVIKTGYLATHTIK